MGSKAAPAAHRPEIDGLRAVAVLLVLLFHSDFTIEGHEPFQGGFVGVDLFFVISGYVITRLIRRETEQGIFSFSAFYQRRARRLLPALFVMLAGTALGAVYFLPAADFPLFTNSVWASLGFYANHFYEQRFAHDLAGAERMPLAHLWSLAIEGQFYALYPFMLFPLLRRGPQKAQRFLVGLGMASFFYAVYLSASGHAGFYSLFARFWELAAGGALALREQREGQPFSFRAPALRRSMPWVGLALILFSSFALTIESGQPSFATLLPVAGTLLILRYAPDSPMCLHLLSSRWAVGIGTLSYALYLWHVPLLTFARTANKGPLSFTATFSLFLSAALLAGLSRRLIETPARYRKREAKNRA